MASLSKSNTYLNDLINAGTDAFPNLFYVEFVGDAVPAELKLTGSNSVTYRINDFSFTPPTHSKSKKDFMTETLEVPNTSFEFTKSFDLKVRIDKDYTIYKQLISLQRTLNTVNSTATTLIGNTFNVNVYKAASSEAAANEIAELSNKALWDKIHGFEYCWISKVTPPTFSYDSSDVQVSTVTVKFYKYVGPDFT